MKRNGLGGVLAAWLCLTSFAPAMAQPISKLESRRLPEAQVRQRVLQQFGKVLLPNGFKGYPGQQPTRPLTRLFYDTVPRAGYIKGMCESDQVILQFRPVESTARKAATLTTVSGVQSKTRYHFAPDADYGSLRTDFDVRKADADCARLDPRKTRFMDADSAEIAVDGARSIPLLMEALKARPSKFEAACEEVKTSCAKLASTLNPASFDAVFKCEDLASSSAQSCLRLYAGGGTAFRVLTVGDPPQVQSIEVEELVVVSDPVAD